MYAVTVDLEASLKTMLAYSVPLESIVVIEETVGYPGELVFQVFDNQQGFYSRYHEWVSCFLVLNELYNLPAFIDQLCKDGYEPVFGPSTEPILANLARWNEPLKIEGYAGAGQ
jgi:hypothetical protein